MIPLRRGWLAASNPRAFFETLPERPAPAAAAAAVAVSGTVGGIVAAALVARLTGSDAWLPLLVAGPLLLLPYLGLLTVLGGLVLMRPAGLDLRAWEIAGWSWVPAGFLALSLLPVGLFAPLPAIVVGLLGLPVWHLWLVRRGVEVHAEGGTRTALVLYGLAVFGAPLALVGFTVGVLSAAA